MTHPRVESWEIVDLGKPFVKKTSRGRTSGT
jgi:hypothetical protein